MVRINTVSLIDVIYAKLLEECMHINIIVSFSSFLPRKEVTNEKIVLLFEIKSHEIKNCM